jgi:hypothetical protein
MKRDDEGNEVTIQAEEKCLKESTERVNEKVRGKQVLGDGRLSVIFGNESVDFTKVYEWGVKHGNWTPEAREALRKRLEDMGDIDEKGQRENLSLSSESRFIYAEGIARTHNIQAVQPELIAKEVKWVIEGLSLP